MQRVGKCVGADRRRLGLKNARHVRWGTERESVPPPLAQNVFRVWWMPGTRFAPLGYTTTKRSMARERSGTLIIIGGHENKDDDPLILKEVVRHVGDGKLVVATVASEVPEQLWEDYERVFRRLGVKHLYKLDVESREDAFSERKREILSDTDAVFFTGGDQLKITSLLGATPICERLREIYARGGTICGTSAGASVMCDTMVVGGGHDGSARIGETVRMAPGLALV